MQKHTPAKAVLSICDRNVYISFKAPVEFKGNLALIVAELSSGEPKFIQLVPEIYDVAVHFGVQGVNGTLNTAYRAVGSVTMCICSGT